MPYIAESLCCVRVPVFLGVARALGRTPFDSTDPPLFCQLYPRPEKLPPNGPTLAIIGSSNDFDPIGSRAGSPSPALSFGTFRPIIPRTLSHNILTPEHSGPGKSASPPLVISNSQPDLFGSASLLGRASPMSPTGKELFTFYTILGQGFYALCHRAQNAPTGGLSDYYMAIIFC